MRDGTPQHPSHFKNVGRVILCTAILSCSSLFAASKIPAPRPVPVESGKAAFDVAASEVDSRTLVIVSALSRQTGPFSVSLKAQGIATENAKSWGDAVDSPSSVGSNRLGPLAPYTLPAPTTRPPVPSRKFHLLVRDGDIASPVNYLGVDARLVAVGKRVQVYADVRDLSEVSETLLHEIVSTFDDHVYPTATSRFGPVEDCDQDGRFTIFLSGWLNRLAGGRIKVDGFVRGADLDRDVGEPFGNRCDMMYLSTSLRPGPHLKTVIAHEYTHAVRFSRKSFPRDRFGRLANEEEGWLDEGLAHLAEDLHGFSRSNLDYRVSAFLSRPEKYRLVVEDYYAADLFRSHGNRGGTYLFLRWCVDRYGDAVLDRMMRSPLRGVANVEAATGRSVAALYREWSTALYLTGLDPQTDASNPGSYRTIDPRGMIEDWILAGPRSDSVELDAKPHVWNAAGTTTHYVVLDAAKTGATRVEINGPAEAELQVTVVSLPPKLGGIRLEVLPTTAKGGAVSVRARVESQGPTSVRLGAISWEPLTPSADSRSSLFRRAGIDMLGIARRFGTSGLAAGGLLASQPIPLEGVTEHDGPIVFKVVGTDAKGRRVAAWAEMSVKSDEPGEGLECPTGSCP